jgi:hypothetical protein
MAITEETLMAYADGVLEDDARRMVEAAIAADPKLAEQVMAHRRAAAAIAKAFAPVLDEPVPERLKSAALGGSRASEAKPKAALKPKAADVVDLAAFRRRAAEAARPQKGWSRPRWGAVGAGLAACLVVGLFVGQSLVPPREAPLGVSAGGVIVARGGLARALDSQLASTQGQGKDPVIIGVSFRATDGRFCRTFQINQGAGLAGLACRGRGGWTAPVIAQAAPGGVGGTGYRTAASDVPAPVIAAINGMIQGDPLDAKGEAAAKASGWAASANPGQGASPH